MGIGIVILFWLIVGGVLLTIYVALRSLGRTSKKANLLKNVFVAVVAAITIPLAALVIANLALGFFPSYVFRSTFGFDPPPTVSELEGGRSVFGDSGETYLRFRTDKATINKLVGTRFVELDAQEKSRHLAQASKGSGDAVLFAKPTTRVYEAITFDDTFSLSTATLVHDEASGMTEFHWLGVD